MNELESEGCIPVLEKTKILKNIESILNSVDYIPPEDVYNKPWQWTNLDPDIIENKITYMMKYSPSSRPAILDTISTLIHKDYLIFTEGPKHRYGSKHYELHLAVLKLLETIEELIDENFSSFLSDVVFWTAKILLAMTEYNIRRHRGLRQKPYEIIKKSETGKIVFKIMKNSMHKCLAASGRFAFKALLSVYSEVAKDEHGREWIFSYLTRDFTLNTCLDLIKFGGNVFRESAKYTPKNPEGIRTMERNFINEYYHLPKFFEYVAKTKELEMRAAFEDYFSRYLDPGFSDNFDAIFLIFSAIYRPTLWAYYLGIISINFDKQKMLKLLKLIQDEYCSILNRTEGRSAMSTLRQSLKFLTPDVTSSILEVIQPMAFDDFILENSNFNFNEQNEIKNELKIICNELLNTFLRTIQASRSFNINHIPFLKKLTSSDLALRQFLQSCVPVSDLNKEKLKLLQGFCYFCSPQFTYTVFSILLLSIHTVPELKQFVIFASTVIPQYPNALLEAFKDVVKKKNYYLKILEKEKMEFNVVKNFGLLLRWSELSENNSYMNFFCLKSEVFMPNGSVMELAGSLIQFSIVLLLEYLEKINIFDMELFKKVSITMDLIKAIDGTAPIESGACYGICRILASVYVHCLRLVKSEDYDWATMAIFKMNEAIRHLLTQQKFEFPKELWASSLVREVLLCSKEIFGIGKDLTGHLDSYRKLIEPCLLPEESQYYEQEFCLLKNYRERPAIGLDQARLLAQTGTLPKSKKVENNQKEFTTPELIRKYIFIYTVDYLITTPKSNPNAPDIVFDGSTTKEIALTLVDVICGEKDLTSFYCWSDWIDDKHHLREFVTIENNINSIPVCYDLMQILAAAPNPTIYCIAPLVKSILGFLINYCETSPVKYSKLPENFVKKIEKLFVLLILAKTEISTILISYEVLTRCTVHEAGAILFEIWRLLMILKIPNEKLVDMMSEISVKPVDQYSEEISSPHRDKVLAILLNTAQRNLKTMVDLIPKIIELMSPEPDQDVWTNDLYPVGSVSGDLKKQ